MTITRLKTLGAEELAALLHRSVATVKTDTRRRPETLPPRFQVPGSNRLMWLEEEVLDWINENRRQAQVQSIKRRRK